MCGLILHWFWTFVTGIIPHTSVLLVSTFLPTATAQEAFPRLQSQLPPGSVQSVGCTGWISWHGQILLQRLHHFLVSGPTEQVYLAVNSPYSVGKLVPAIPPSLPFLNPCPRGGNSFQVPHHPLFDSQIFITCLPNPFTRFTLLLHEIFLSLLAFDGSKSITCSVTRLLLVYTLKCWIFKTPLGKKGL